VERPHVIVVGGGISGLTAAYALTGGVAPDQALSVTVLEHDDRLGGKLASVTLGGQRIDTGPDGFLARRPEALTLCRELGAEQFLEVPGALGASIFARGKLRPMPTRLNLGVPTSWRALARSGVLSWPALVRAGLDVVAPRRDLRGPLGDRAIGPFVEKKLGRAVVATLVDPMIGGIHAGRVADMSAAVVFPPLLAAAGDNGSLMHAMAKSLPPAPPTDAPAPPVFNALHNSTSSLIDLLREELLGRGVTITTGAQVTAIDRAPLGTGTWTVTTPSTTMVGDGLILATPTPVTAQLVGEVDHELAGLLSTIDYASVATVTLVVPSGVLPEDRHGTGLLIPAIARRRDGAAFLASAVTWLSRKWPHLGRPDTELVRLSTGRIDDQRFTAMTDLELTAALRDELAEVIGVSIPVGPSSVTRWMDAFPQYRVNHALRVQGIEAAAASHPSLAVCGAAYHGIGIPACIGSGRTAAAAVRAQLLGDPQS
jgi:protoporphyrinogen/coproporphyrinogen III oxidase